MQYTDVLLSQETGTKARCLKALQEKGYEPEQILMVGDSPSDLEAAREVEHFLSYHGISGTESWEEFPEALNCFQEGTYAGRYQEQKILEFEKNLRL